MSDITIYVKDGCPYCAAAMKHFREQGISFNEINIFKVAGAKEKLIELTKGERVVPVIVEGEKVTVGFGGG